MLHEILHFLGGAICHQIEERSLHASGKALSVCARDTGIYIGIFSSLIYLHLVKRKTSITISSIKVSFFLLLFMLPLIIDGVGSYAHLFESTNARRLVTGICFGLVLPYFLYPLLSAKALEPSSQPIINQRKDVLIPLFLSVGLGSLVYWGRLPYYLLDGYIILMIVIWFSLCSSFLFSRLRVKPLKWVISILSSFAFLSILSLLHQLVI
ncbi:MULTISPECIES: DUF2085 domain-containing protein [Neobacillus]|uniref:DUF2085 domain-containing protein n=1 Tax=Neobacillus rhizophilus TaxID=2833579 RepID=A0A942YX13_9BACI|nr:MULTISPECIES: DUF2085 domain-containing protein [Neobacillus]MBS4213286.1 DUF2085 domain-containing protein [Neobacillus rhizophilus]